MRQALVASLALVSLAITAPALALTQPNGATIPSPPGCNAGKPTGLLPIFACECTQPGTCNIGAVCPDATTCDDGKHGTCESRMWHVFNDNTCIPSQHDGIDPIVDAATTPETFHPACALTFTVVSRGTAIFKNVFGWYNVTGKAPDASDLHPMLQCGDAAGTSALLDVTKEPAYKGGDVGFFLLTPEQHGKTGACANNDCCATLPRFMNGEGYAFYSQREFNPDAAGASSYIHLLTYDSKIASHKFYFAWEDVFGGASGDFTDLVTSVEGVECSGAGQECSTGQQGICARGVTKCDKGAISCGPIFQPGQEACNGLDDDCDGKVDDGATCPAPSDVCENGKCVHHCGGVEFKCAGGTQCDDATGLCVDPACVGVACAADKVCRGGACVAPCDGVACPHGQTCVGNACVDLCGGVACAAGQVCKDGQCFAGCNSCAGLACAAGMQCDAASGACFDPSCAKPCPSGTFCKQGQCVDACDGAQCPTGQTCVMGVCGGGGAGDGGSLGGLGPTNAGVDGGVADGGDNADTPWGANHAGCQCVAGAERHPAGGAALGWGGLAMLGVIVAGRRRRR